MPSVRGCNLPDDLLYDVDNHIWFREQGDGTVKLGMTAVATAMAGKLVAYTPKRVGRQGVRAYYSGSPDLAGTVNVVRLTPAGKVVVRRHPVALEIKE